MELFWSRTRACLNFKLKTFFKILFWNNCRVTKIVQRISLYPSSRFPTVNILCNPSTVIKIRKLTLIQGPLIYRPHPHFYQLSHWVLCLVKHSVQGHMWVLLSCVCFLSFEIVLQSLSFMALTLLENTGQLFIIGILKVSVLVFKLTIVSALEKESVKRISVPTYMGLLFDV